MNFYWKKPKNRATEVTEMSGTALWFPQKARRCQELLCGFHRRHGNVGNCSVVSTEVTEMSGTALWRYF